MPSFSPEAFSSFLRELGSAIEDDPMLKEKEAAAEEFRKIQAENFGRESDEFGAAWAPRKGNYDHPPLRDTRAMWRAATQSGAPGAIQEMGRGFLLMGISGGEIDYASKHQDGKDGMVQRKFFYLRKEDVERLRGPVRIAMLRVLRETVRKRADG